MKKTGLLLGRWLVIIESEI